MKVVTVVPSYPAPTFSDLITLARDVSGMVSELQVDIVDGKFVPASSWPFTDTKTPIETSLARLRELPNNLAIEMDCMVVNPLQYMRLFVGLPVTRVIIHYGSTDNYQACLAFGREQGYMMGLALLPTVDFAEVKALIEQFEYVQIMGIAEVGKQSQPFAPESLDLIAEIVATYPNKEVAVDGSVNEETIPALVKAGATRLAPGSAVVKAPERAIALENLTRLANS